MDLTDVDYEDGTNPIPGEALYGYIAKLKDILTLQEPSASPTTPDEIVTIATAHVMKTGKKFIKLYSVKNQGEKTFNGIGGIKMVASEGKIMAFLPGDSALTRGIVTLIQNTDLIGLFPDREGLITQYGDKNLPMTLEKWEFKGGKKAGDDKGWLLTFSFDGKIPFVYDAAVPLTPGP